MWAKKTTPDADEETHHIAKVWNRERIEPHNCVD